jgi:hypothetical protein
VANPLQLFTTRASKFTHPDGTLTREAIRTFELLFSRVGGAVSASTSDLALSDDDDSGLEEFKHEAGKVLDGIRMEPPVFFPEFTDPLYPLHQEHSEIQHLLSEVSELRETVAELQKQIQGLQEGTTI